MGMGVSRKSKVMADINVTPLVDVMLVLLIIFMVTAPLLQQGIDVNLPETASSGIQTSDEPFILVITKEGQISAGSVSIALAEIRTRIDAIFKTRKNKQLYIQADKKTEYGVVAEVMAEARAAGVFNISLVTILRNKP